MGLKEYMHTRTYGEWLFIFFLICLSSYFIFNFIAALLLLIIGAGGTESLTDIYENPAGNIQQLKYLQIILAIGIFIVPALAFSYLTFDRPFKFLKLASIPRGNLVVFSVLIVLMAAPTIYFFLDLNQRMHLPPSLQWLEDWMKMMEERSNFFIEEMLVMNSWQDLLLNLLVIAVLPALGEELLFRGTLQQLLHRYFGNAHLAIFVAGALFSFVHFQFFGFLPRMLLGILFGYLFYWSSNLWIPIIGHFIHNGATVFLIYMFGRGMIETDINEIESFPIHLTVITALILTFMLFTFYKTARRSYLNSY